MYSDFENEFLVACYLYTEETGEDYIKLRKIVDRFPIERKPKWAYRALTSFVNRGVSSDARHLGGDELDQSVHLTPYGFHEAERLIKLKIVDPTKLENMGVQVDVVSSPTVDSSQWTGLPKDFQLTDEKRALLVKALSSAELELDSLGVGNQEKAQVRAYIVAMRILAEAPDPPSDVIWEILGRANSISGIASLFVSIISLFVAGS